LATNSVARNYGLIGVTVLLGLSGHAYSHWFRDTFKA
jgi:hypothetical protein